MENRFFAVTAKCGHVGRKQYYEGTFYIKASMGSEAAAITRSMPRVKHNHKDAILRVEEVSAEVYKAGKAALRTEVYFLCISKHEQNLVWDEITPKLHTEAVRAHEYRKKDRYEECDLEPKLKKPYKRERLKLCMEDFFLDVA